MRYGDSIFAQLLKPISRHWFRGRVEALDAGLQGAAILAEGLGTSTDGDCYHALCRGLKRVDPALAA